jgi:hypothetical protein
MSAPELSLEQAYDLLTSWSQTLANRAKSVKDETFSSLDPATVLPKNCPSRASLALLVFSKIKSDLEEVAGAVKMVEEAIRRSGK